MNGFNVTNDVQAKRPHWLARRQMAAKPHPARLSLRVTYRSTDATYSLPVSVLFFFRPDSHHRQFHNTNTAPTKLEHCRYLIRFESKTLPIVVVGESTLHFCVELQARLLSSSDSTRGEWSLPIIDVQVDRTSFIRVKEWCEWHIDAPCNDDDDDDDYSDSDASDLLADEDDPDALVELPPEFGDARQIPKRLALRTPSRCRVGPWDDMFCRSMRMSERMHVIECANALGNEKMVDTMCKFIAKMLRRKTPEAIRKIFGITDTGFTKEEEERWHRDYGWCLKGCDDNRGEETEEEEARQAAAESDD